jgi:hypothetical protein
MLRAMLVAGAMLGLMVMGSQAASAQSGSLVYGLNDAGELIGFDPANPAQVETRVAVGGDASGDAILGMDFRPETDELYAAGASSTIYTIDPASGAATAEGTTDPAIEGSVIGFDFNPTADAIRVVTDAGQNLRLTDLDEEIGTTVDGELAFDDGDENAGAQPAAVGAGYTNNVPDAEDTMLFDIDLATGSLLQQDANPGILSTIGPLGVEFTSNVGFDIAAPNDDAYAVLQPGEGQPSSLYEIDLDSGAATEIGAIGAGEVVGGFAIPTGDMSAMMDDMDDTAGAGTTMETIPDTGGFSPLAVIGAALAAFAVAGGAIALRTVRRDAS